MIQGIGHIHVQAQLLLSREEDTPRMAAVCPMLEDVWS
jgi:hypothetical protein